MCVFFLLITLYFVLCYRVVLRTAEKMQTKYFNPIERRSSVFSGFLKNLSIIMSQMMGVVGVCPVWLRNQDMVFAGENDYINWDLKGKIESF